MSLLKSLQQCPAVLTPSTKVRDDGMAEDVSFKGFYFH